MYQLSVVIIIIERPLEDHEEIDEIVTKWPKKNPPHFHLHTYHEKYLLWEDNPVSCINDISVVLKTELSVKIKIILIYYYQSLLLIIVASQGIYWSIS